MHQICEYFHHYLLRTKLVNATKSHQIGEQEVNLPNHEIRLTVRIPADAAAYLASEAKENFTSKNAQIVRAIRAAMKAKGPAEAATSPSQG